MVTAPSQPATRPARPLQSGRRNIPSVLAAQHGRAQRMLPVDVLTIALAAVMPILLSGLVLLRELAPLVALRAPLHALAEDPRQELPRGPGAGSPRPLARDLAQAIERTAAHIRELERARLASVADTRLLEYARNEMQAVLQCLPDGVQDRRLQVLDACGQLRAPRLCLHDRAAAIGSFRRSGTMGVIVNVSSQADATASPAM